MQYLERVHQAVDTSDLFVGLVKAPVFRVRHRHHRLHARVARQRLAESCRRETTRAVVKSIFLVIVLDALFSIPVRKGRTCERRDPAQPILSARGIVNRFGKQELHDTSASTCCRARSSASRAARGRANRCCSGP
jgi:hypothetical protein